MANKRFDYEMEVEDQFMDGETRKRTIRFKAENDENAKSRALRIIQRIGNGWSSMTKEERDRYLRTEWVGLLKLTIERII